MKNHTTKVVSRINFVIGIWNATAGSILSSDVININI